jgi:hypothetical protein
MHGQRKVKETVMRILAIITSIVLLSGSASADSQLGWADLIDPAAQNYEDPYLSLESDDLDNLRTVATESARLEAGGLSEENRAAIAQKLEDARSDLAAVGIDADWLISQRWVVAERREKAATFVNPEIDGAQVSLGGFAIPAPPAADGTPIVYLVPERGMCSHMPPPNPNQMIRARLSGDWSPSMMHEPVRLSGTLIVDESEYAFHIVDGVVAMKSSLVMYVSEVETMPAFSSRVPGTNYWAAKLSEQLRATRQSASQTEED